MNELYLIREVSTDDQKSTRYGSSFMSWASRAIFPIMYDWVSSENYIPRFLRIASNLTLEILPIG
jgi:hypothetical protein